MHVFYICLSSVSIGEMNVFIGLQPFCHNTIASETTTEDRQRMTIAELCNAVAMFAYTVNEWQQATRRLMTKLDFHALFSCETRLRWLWGWIYLTSGTWVNGQRSPAGELLGFDRRTSHRAAGLWQACSVDRACIAADTLTSIYALHSF